MLLREGPLTGCTADSYSEARSDRQVSSRVIGTGKTASSRKVQAPRDVHGIFGPPWQFLETTVLDLFCDAEQFQPAYCCRALRAAYLESRAVF
jgi:hypothetical protein